MANRQQGNSPSQLVPLRLGKAAYNRQSAQQADIRLINRYFEENPTNLDDFVSLLSRPPTTKETDIGSGRIRGMFAQEGSFAGDLFVASGTALYRYTKAGAIVSINGTLSNDGDVFMVATADYLFLTDGAGLYYYSGDEAYATGDLGFTANAFDGETFTVGSRTYTWKGTLTGAANEILIGASAGDSIDNAVAAINGSVGAGSIYGTGTTANTDVTARYASADSMEVTAIVPGGAPNLIETTETMDYASWGATSLTGGANASLNAISTPDGVSISSLAILAQYIICPVADQQKWYYIEPGAVTIDALNFYSAEQIPDAIIRASSAGDNVAFFGSQSTEFWYANGAGDPDDPFSRMQGAAFSRGVQAGTDVLINNRLIVVADDNTVRDGLTNQVLSNYAVSELIRRAKEAQ